MNNVICLFILNHTLLINHTYNEINNHFVIVYNGFLSNVLLANVSNYQSYGNDFVFQYMYDDVQLTFRWISLTHTSLHYNKREIHVCIEIVLFHS